jgi:serine/threonine-protein kinase
VTSSVADALVGRVIDGRYRILSHLADGGMASVYVALDARLDREVALKIMRPGLAVDDVFVERFRSEARSAARLSHPNVVAVFDQGEDDGDVFLAMELVEGKTLREVIHEEAPLTAREALAILEPILLALRAAHAAGMIHRDVKPENVIVRHDGEVKVADFGLARAITNQTATSQTGVLLGTVSYLSPEQVERGQADARSDVYAAGLLLFEMLTGRKAVTGDTPIQIAYQHVHGSIPAPSTLVPEVPRPLDELVARSTALDPDHRFDSAAELVAALRHVRRVLSPTDLDRRGTAPRTDTAVRAPAAADTSARTASPGDTGELTGLHTTPVLERTTAMPLTAIPVQRRRRRRWPAWLAAVLLVLGGGAAGWWFTAGPGGTTVVPGLVGQSVAQARSSLQAASLSMDEHDEFSETAAKGTVLRIEPGAGTQLSKDSTIRVVVSKGQERYTVPKLVGTKAADAVDVLGPLTLTVGDTRQQWSETVPKGRVVSQSPDPEASVKRGTAVDLVVSKGPEPIDVPKVTGTPFDAAAAKLGKLGFQVRRGADVNSDTVPAGNVVSQDPASGTLHRGDAVTLVVSKGPVMVQVPNVVDQQDALAEKALTDLGFTVDKQYPFGDLFEKKVRAQDPAAGTTVPKGSTIHLTIV